MTPTKTEFRELFMLALNIAAENAEQKFGRTIPRCFVIEFHGPGPAGNVVSVDEAFDHIYLGSDRFYKIIDVAIKALLPGKSVAFVRVSGHRPEEFDKTWDPDKMGPFKQIIPEKIEDRSQLTT